MGWKQLQLMLKHSEDLATNVSVCARHFFWGTKHPTFFLRMSTLTKTIALKQRVTSCHTMCWKFFRMSTKNQPKRKKQNNPWPTLFRLKSSVSPGFPPFCHLGLHKFTGQNPADVQVLRVGFERLVVSQDLCSAGGGHRSHQQAVAKSMLGLRKTKLQVRSVSDRPTKPQ